MLYSWEHPQRVQASKGPSSFLPPHLSFTVLLPARHEEAVIYETIKRVWSAHYPSELLEVVVVCHADDMGTIAEAERAIQAIGSPQVRVETFSTPPINKPHGLNVGFQRTRNEVVTIFDAEDDIHPDIFNVVNTVMLQEGVGIVQAGVQLMNFHDHWFSVHNCLEYFFWFKSRLHFHARVGMIPLGGNTVFMRRSLIERVGGWDEHCLTEDADIGLRLSSLGEPIRVVYDAEHVTREETPESIGSFIRQRTRWQQGFLQVLAKGTWKTLPRFRQRLLAVYTLSYPFFQAFLILLWPLTVGAVLRLKVSVLVAMISFLPLYALLFQFVASAVGAFMFAREYNLKVPFFKPVSMALTFLPFHWLLGIGAVRGVYRQLRKQNNWEKTIHLGAHRQSEAGSSLILGHEPQLVPQSAIGALATTFISKQAHVLLSRKHTRLQLVAFWSTSLKQATAGLRAISIPNQMWKLSALVAVILTLLISFGLGTGMQPALLASAPHSTAQRSISLSEASSSDLGERMNSLSVLETYYGRIYDLTTNTTTAMSLTMLNEGKIVGYFAGWQIYRPFTGLKDAENHIEFTVVDPTRQVTLTFEGVVHSNGALAGSYCSLNKEGRCMNQFGYGLWSATPAFIGGGK